MIPNRILHPELAYALATLGHGDIVMVTDAGQLIRCPVGDISINGRTTRGVKLFDTAEGERVVSVSRIRDVEENGPDAGNNRTNGDSAADASEQDGGIDRGELPEAGGGPSGDGR